MPQLIRTSGQCQEALAQLGELWRLDPEPGTAEHDQMELLELLIHKFESEEYPIEPLDAVDLLQHMLEIEKFTRKDLVKVLGGGSRVSEFFNRKRNLSLGAIRRLNYEWGLSLEVLIRPTKQGEEQPPDEVVGASLKSGETAALAPNVAAQLTSLFERGEILLEQWSELASEAVVFGQAVREMVQRESVPVELSRIVKMALRFQQTVEKLDLPNPAILSEVSLHSR